MTFLKNLGCDGKNIEFRHFPNGKPVSLRSVPKDLSGHTDLYFVVGGGVRIGRYTKDVDVTSKGYMVIDIDIRSNLGGETPDSVIEEAVVFIVSAYKEHKVLSDWRYIVYSGNGLHIYYTAPKLIETDLVEYKNATQWLYNQSDLLLPDSMRSDHSCKNISRITRCIGTVNAKRSERYGLSEAFTVSVAKEQDKNCSIFSDLSSYAKETLSKVVSSHKKTKYSNGDGEVFDLICDISSTDFADIVSKELGMAGYKESSNYIHLLSPKDGKNSSLFIVKGSNLLISDGSKYLSSDEDAYNCFSFVNKELGLSAKDTFDYFKEKFTHIYDAGMKEERAITEKPKKEKVEGKRESLLENKPLDQKFLAKRLNPLEEAKLFLLEHTFAYHRGDVYISKGDSPLYSIIDEDVLKNIILSHLDNKFDKVTTKQVVEVLTFIKIKSTDISGNTRTLHEPDDNVIPLKHHKITITGDSYSVSDITRKDFISGTIDIDHNEVLGSTDPERWLDFLKRMLCGYTDKEAVMETIQEFCGICLVGGNPGERALILIGGGGNGKGVFTKTLAGIMGSRAVGLTITNKMGEDFSLPGMIGKTLAIDYDMGKVQLDDHLIKKLISGEEINMNRKYRDRVPFKNKASLIMCTNKEPWIKDKDNSIKRRGIIVQCLGDIETVEKVERMDQVLVEKEGPQILNWMISGLMRVLERGTIKMATELVGGMQDFIDEQDLVLQYLIEKEEQGDIQHGVMSLKHIVSDDFNRWLRGTGHKPWGHNTICKRMRYHFERFKIDEVQKMVGGKRFRAYEGIDVSDLLSVRS